MNKKIKRFFRKLKTDLLRLAIWFCVMFLAAFAVCFILSLPEIIGCLIFGF